MVTQNPAFQVLVVNDNIAAIAAGSTVDQLAPGQIGFFSYETNLAIDGTVPSSNRSFYIAVGVDRLNAGTIQDVVKSAGSNIQKHGIRAYTVKPYVAAVNKKIVLSVGKVQCNTEYALKFNIQSELAYRNYGFNTPSKTFTAFTTACTDTCIDCAAGDPNSFVKGVAAEIALDPDKIFTTRFLSPRTGAVVNDPVQFGLGFNSLSAPVGLAGTPTTGTGTKAAGTYRAVVTGIDANGESLPSVEASAVLSATGEITWNWTALAGAVSYRLYTGANVAGDEVAYFTSSTNSVLDNGAAGTAGTPPVAGTATSPNTNAGLVAQLEITVNATPLYVYSQINLNYMDPRQVNVVMSLLSDPNSPNGFGTFGPDTTQAVTQALVYEDGSGYDIQQLEYIAGGWNGKPGPYRTSELVGVPVAGAEYFSVITGQYITYCLTYENKGIGGGHEYKSSLATYIAIPTANTTAQASVNALLHRIVDDATGNDSTVNSAFPAEYNSGVIVD